MDWSNERYVRLYTRDTATWRRLGWEGQCLLCLMLRKVDRSGVIDGVVDAVDDLILMTGLPPDAVEAGYKALVRHKVIITNGDVICLPNFLEAQETPKSDAQRQRDCRESRRVEALLESRSVTDESQSVTDGSQNVTPESRAVTPSHAESRPVTPTLTDPNLPGPNLTKPRGSDAPARDQVQEDKDKTPAPHLVALCLELWPEWPQDQIEQSVMAWGSARLEVTERVLRDAAASLNPREPYSRIHTWVVRQAQFAARDAERDSAHTQGRPQPEYAPTPDEPEETDEERKARIAERDRIIAGSEYGKARIKTGGEG